MSFHRLNGFLIPNRNDLENMIAKRRAREAEHLLQWKDHSQYYNTSLVRAEKEKQWTSTGTFQSSMEAFTAQKEEGNSISPRRLKLRELFDKESSQQKLLLEAISEKPKDRTSMLIRSTALKQTRDQERAELAKKLLADHFRKNNADLKSIIQTEEQKACINVWSEQKEEKREKQEINKLQELEAQADEEEQARKETMESEEIKERQLMAKQEHLQSLQRQLDEIHQREEEANALAEEEKKLSWNLSKLENLARERQAIEERCKRELYGRALLRQHQAALRRRSAVVQAELEADLDWLSQIAKDTQMEDQIRISKRQQERDNLSETRELIQKELEKERKIEMELDAMQSHEAARLWSRREEEWRKETEARQKLLQDVLKERRDQIYQKLEDNRRRQHDELETREYLLESLENAHQNTVEDKQNRLSSRNCQRKELESQIMNKQEKKLEAQQSIEAEEKAAREAERAYEEMIRQEADRLKITEAREATPTNSRRADVNCTVRSRPGGNIW
ncbi:Trichoplein keratin filament-binding protein [Fasciola hepatica]|uniref:Trichoplein keratin filament-binding protein n=1 Tax=Fasciola hepatica TaxID=6192 RepID=A0A4E0R6G1_FASHE|nr:Trichoplein keratin filament-binding protein [Fasciola hepatica]